MSLIYQETKRFIKVYTRGKDAVPGRYPDGLAHSVHFAAGIDGIHFEPLHQNYGILFAEGLITEQNIIRPKGVRDPRICRGENGEYLILAIRTEENGSQEKEIHVEGWRTRDFCRFSKFEKADFQMWENASDRIEIERSLCDRASLFWGRICNVAVQTPDGVEVASEEELKAVKVKAVYSDGSVVYKPVDWNLNGVDFSEEGTVTVTGCVRQQHYPFPLISGYGDPVLMKWEGKWYYISTNDNTDNIGIYVREADTVPELFEEGRKEYLILDVDEEKEFIQTFWAPEFHVIGGELYLLLAIGGKVWAPQCYVMKFRKNGKITDPDSWETPRRVLLKDGTPLAQNGISLDMTFIRGSKASYMAWSYREKLGTPLDSGSMIYIAEVDEAEPWKLISEPVLLTRPVFGWENVENTINNEGPYALEKDGMIYMTYSAGSASRYSYTLGLLTARKDADLCDPASWEKSPAPVLSFYSVDGVYGAGHNSFFIDDEGNLMITYHGESDIDSSLRCPGIRRVHFDINGRPVFNLSEERDLNPELRDVQMQITIKRQ